MVWSPKISNNEKKVLKIISKGHPNRIMKVHFLSLSSRSMWNDKPLKWDEIQIASDMEFSQFSNTIAHLRRNNFIDSAIENKGC